MSDSTHPIIDNFLDHLRKEEENETSIAAITHFVASIYHGFVEEQVPETQAAYMACTMWSYMASRTEAAT